jgi:hypothetical protein
MSPFSQPCGNFPICNGYATGPDILCHSCQRAACPTCGTDIPDTIIRGKAYRVKRRTHIRKPYHWVSDEEVLYFRPIPVVIVEEKWTAPPKEPLTEPKAGQP